MPPALRARLNATRKSAPVLPAAPRAPKAPRRDPEHVEQVTFFIQIRELARVDQAYEVAARRTFAIPNGGSRTKREAGRLKAEGVTPGVSDIFCSVARAGHHGLYIEMKSPTGSASAVQREWITESQDEGYAAFICRGAEAALQVWKAYVDGGAL